MEFKVKGISLKNEDGKDIQQELKKAIKEFDKDGQFNEKYCGYTNSEIKEMELEVGEYEDETLDVSFKEDTFKDKPCVKIYVEKLNGELLHVGYVPKELVDEFLRKKKNSKTTKSYASILGGKCKYCEFYEEDYEEKERVATKELTYGLEVKVVFHNNDDKATKEDSKIEEFVKECDSSEDLSREKKEQIKKENRKADSKKWYQRWWVLLIIAIFILWVMSNISNSDKKNTSNNTNSYKNTYSNTNYTNTSKTTNNTTNTANKTNITTNSNVSSSSTVPNTTTGQKNALSKAKSYLNYTAFSYDGLIKQLEYEGFSNKEATYGADNCGANWNEQASKKAKQYINYSSFSRKSLIEQLEYEGFTSAQAEYGASAVGY